MRPPARMIIWTIRRAMIMIMNHMMMIVIMSVTLMIMMNLSVHDERVNAMQAEEERQAR